jgi:predicted acylesterase/phospholipase RssA
MQDQAENTSPRRKLGLALAGGGFRASLFHLGVLHRLAEMDLLRYVEVLSTVSGGSIIGALYILLLKKKIDENKNLQQSDYKIIVSKLDDILVKGIKKNLRTRLFMNPLGVLRVMLTHDSLGRRMARIYERYIYKEAVEEMTGVKTGWWDILFRPGRFLLKDLRVSPGGQNVKGGFEDYNCRAVDSHESVITHLILNSTTLNSGMPFQFSSIEIGDPRLGLFRYDEIGQILERKKLLLDIHNKKSNIDPLYRNLSSSVRSLAEWWHALSEEGVAPSPSGWSNLFNINRFPGHLTNAELGQLRTMKLCAWYVLTGTKRTPPICGGLPNTKHMARFWETFDQIDNVLAAECQKEVHSNSLLATELLEFVLELYYLRSAKAASDKIRDDYSKLRLGEAVGASACFPPIFPPFIFMGIYDDLYVTRLGLTDGGVCDNVGITALLEENCNHIIASDTSGLFDVEQRSTTHRIGMSLRIVSTLMNNLATAQRYSLRDRRRVTQKIDQVSPVHPSLTELKENFGLDGLAFFHIGSPSIGTPGYTLNLDEKIIASLRTDLDGFGDVEIAALVNHGYFVADMYIKEYLKNTYYAAGEYWNSSVQAPKEMLADRARAEKILKVGSSRVFRSLLLRAPESWIFTLAVLVISIRVLWNVRLSAQDIAGWFAIKVFQLFDPVLSLVRNNWSNQKVSLGIALAMLSIAVALFFLSKLLPRVIRRVSLVGLRKLMTIRKWLRSLSGNILWAFYFLPALIALIISALGCISHFFYYRPFERVTRISRTNSQDAH